MDRHGKKRPFWQDERGNVAMIWAIMGGALAALIGLSIDFARAQTLRSEMQNAVDGAVLVAERSSSLNVTQRTAAARAYFDPTFGTNQPITGSVTFTVTPQADGGHRVDATVLFDNNMSFLAGVLFGSGRGPNWRVSVNAVAQASASPPIEVALVLDNTGSMEDDMADLRTKTQELVEYLMSIDGDSVSVALVPFVAQVNVGSQYRSASWIDSTGVGTLNGEIMEDRQIYFQRINNCSTSATPSTTMTVGSGTGAAAYPIVWGACTTATISGTSRQGRWAYSPSTISHLALFDRLALINSNYGWKGCVEARPDLSGTDYDIDDTPPNSGNPATLFVPYFWVDGYDSPASGTSATDANNYITDSFGATSGWSSSNNIWYTNGSVNVGRQLSPWKYRTGVTHTILSNTSTPDARGANRGCPTPIVPLTTNEATVIAGVQAMRHWDGGGTNQAAGLSWGWRVLSPTAPFTEGRPYNDPANPVKKVIVMMTDGDNTNINTTGETVLGSDYSSYSYLAQWTASTASPPGYRSTLPTGANRTRDVGGAIGSSDNYVDYINQREERVCTLIKAQNIEIYTIQFRDTNDDNEARLRNCATNASHFYHAADASELQAAFTAIGSGIGKLRLTQ
jgi:Flp pilus assembly protein TadG